MPAAARRFDDKRIPGMNRNRVTAFKVYYGFIAAYDVIAARHSGFAAGHAIRTNGAMSGHECGGHGFEKAQTAQRAVAAPPTSAATAAPAN